MRIRLGAILAVVAAVSLAELPRTINGRLVERVVKTYGAECGYADPVQEIHIVQHPVPGKEGTGRPLYVVLHSAAHDAERAILDCLDAPLSFAPYYTDATTGDVYYRINVRNFSIYYVVIGSVMEVRWFRYSRRMFP